MRWNVVALVALLWALTGAGDGFAAPASDDGHATVAAAAPQTDEHGADEHADDALHTDDHGGDHGDAHGAHGEHLELPHLFMVLRNIGPLAGNEELGKLMKKWENPFFAVLAGSVVCFIFWIMYRKRSDIPGRLQAFGEILMEQVLSITQTMLGEKDGRKYAPFIATIFVYLLAMNYSALIPLGKAPTATLINNASIAICVFLYVQYTGIRRNGIGGYLHHLAGSPKDAVGWAISPLMFFLEVVGEFIKPMSLSLRLFGNIFGEDTLLAVFALLGVVVMTLIGTPEGTPIGFPLHLPFLFLSMLLGLIQALVFSLLSTVYISLMLPHDEHEHEALGAH